MKAQFLLLLFLLFLGKQGQAQKNKIAKVKNVTLAQIGFNGMATSQLGHLSNAGHNLGRGLSMDYFAKSLIHKTSPMGWHLQLGGSWMFAQYGFERSNVHMHVPKNAPGKQTFTNNLLAFDFRTRFTHHSKYLSPYVDAIGGIGYYFSDQTLELNPPVKGYRRDAEHTMYSGSAFETGISAGCQVALGKNVQLDIRATYLQALNSVKVTDFHSLSFDGYMNSSSGSKMIPSMLLYQVGLSFRLTGNKGGSRSHCGHCGSFHSVGHCGGGGMMIY